MKLKNLQRLVALVICGAACGQGTVAAGAHTDRALKSCYRPDFDPRSKKTFITLDSPSYLTVHEKAKKSDSHDARNLPLALISGRFTMLGGIDIFIPFLTLPCTYKTYDSDKCQMTSLYLSGSATLEDVVLKDQQLSYTLRKPDEDQVFEVTFGDRDFNRMQLIGQEDGVTTESTWTRDSDGTEYYAGKSSDGSAISYVERPDCSGKAEIVDAENGKITGKTSFKWTSAKRRPVKVQYTACNYKDGGRCVSGGF